MFGTYTCNEEVRYDMEMVVEDILSDYETGDVYVLFRGIGSTNYEILKQEEFLDKVTVGGKEFDRFSFIGYKYKIGNRAYFNE